MVERPPHLRSAAAISARAEQIVELSPRADRRLDAEEMPEKVTVTSDSHQAPSHQAPDGGPRRPGGLRRRAQLRQPYLSPGAYHRVGDDAA
jgi:hypothetical protein